MKKFLDYMIESEKQYEFKIRIAGHSLPTDCANKIEMALQKYEMVSCSTGRTTPIQENPLMFPQIHNCEVTTYDAVLKYPATAPVLQKHLSDVVGLPITHLLVTSATEPFEELMVPKETVEYESLLTNPVMADTDPDAQSKVGNGRVMDLLKELEKDRAECKIGDPTEGTPVGTSEDISPSENTKPVIGG